MNTETECCASVPYSVIRELRGPLPYSVLGGGASSGLRGAAPGSQKVPARRKKSVRAVTDERKLSPGERGNDMKKKTKFIIVSTVITLLVVMLMLYLNELLINSSKPQGYLVKTVKSPDKVYRLNSYRYMSNNKWSTVVFLYNNETLNAYKIYTSSEKDTNISWLNNKKIKIWNYI